MAAIDRQPAFRLRRLAPERLRRWILRRRHSHRKLEHMPDKRAFFEEAARVSNRAVGW